MKILSIFVPEDLTPYAAVICDCDAIGIASHRDTIFKCPEPSCSAQSNMKPLYLNFLNAFFPDLKYRTPLSSQNRFPFGPSP